MVSITPQIINYNNVKTTKTTKTAKPIAFAGSYSENLKIATELMKKLAAENIEQPNKLGEWLTSPLVRFRDEAERRYFLIRAQFSGLRLEAMRDYMKGAKFLDDTSWTDLYERLVLLTKTGLCGELSRVMNKWLAKEGVDSFMSAPCAVGNKKIGCWGVLPTPKKAIDHRFVVIRDGGMYENSEVSSLLTDKSAIIVDPQLGRIFTNPEEALSIYRIRFGLRDDYNLGDVSTYRNSNKKKSLSNSNQRRLAALENVFQMKWHAWQEVVIPELKKRKPFVRQEMLQESFNNGFADYKDF